MSHKQQEQRNSRFYCIPSHIQNRTQQRLEQPITFPPPISHTGFSYNPVFICENPQSCIKFHSPDCYTASHRQCCPFIESIYAGPTEASFTPRENQPYSTNLACSYCPHSSSIFPTRVPTVTEDNSPYYSSIENHNNQLGLSYCGTSPSPASLSCVQQNRPKEYVLKYDLNKYSILRLYCSPDSPIKQLQKEKLLKSQQPSHRLMALTKPKLIWLFFMHRHGDRAPLNMAPRDKYNDSSYWPEGFGNLNNAGRKRMYEVGQFIRSRYESFLTDNIREVYSRSSDVDRCIESSHAVLAGMYPPSNRFLWNKEIPWIPAPVHTVPPSDDYLLCEAGKKYLPELIKQIHVVQKSEAVKNLYEESKNERELLERELGYDYELFFTFKCTYSTLDIEQRNGLDMPTWYTPELKEKLYRYAGIAFGLAGGGTETLKKIRCGPLLQDLVGRMESVPVGDDHKDEHSDMRQETNAQYNSTKTRVVHYSTHDSIMAAFLESLNINTPIPVPPGFGSTFFLELYVDVNEQGLPTSEKYIKLYYMDDTGTQNPVEKILPNCKVNEKNQMTVENFKKYVEHLFPEESPYAHCTVPQYH